MRRGDQSMLASRFVSVNRCILTGGQPHHEIKSVVLDRLDRVLRPKGTTELAGRHVARRRPL